jgi:hypothetical protein
MKNFELTKVTNGMNKIDINLRENLQAATLDLPAETLAKLNTIVAKSEQKE